MPEQSLQEPADIPPRGIFRVDPFPQTLLRNKMSLERGKTTTLQINVGLLCNQEFNVYDFPKVRWRWKVDNIFQKGNAKTKEGNDYPLRIYILFKYDPERASGWEKIQYQYAKLIYGEYPPHSTIDYIWSSRQHPETIITNSHSNKSKMILLQKGLENVAKWVDRK